MEEDVFGKYFPSTLNDTGSIRPIELNIFSAVVRIKVRLIDNT